MYRPILTCAFLVLSAAAFAQQQSSPSDPNQGQYQGQSNPPADDVIVATQPDQPTPPKAKPHAGKHVAQPQTPPPASDVAPSAAASSATTTQPDSAASRPTSVDPSANFPDPDVNGTDDGIVGVAKPQPAAQPQPNSATVDSQPALMSRGAASDPDGDIVNPNPLQPGQLAQGATIRVRLLTRLSTTESQQGEVFRTRVASDVLQDGQVIIPAGAEIDGRVAQVSSGTMRSHGTILIRPDTVILADGSRYHLDAQVTGTPGSRTRVNGEGFINPGSRVKRNAILYGGAVGVGATAGALIAGPVGAVTGSVIGAGAVTAHIVFNHSEATLEPGTVLLLTLDNRLDLQAAAPPANPTGN
jgi:type IV secretory pathway VirB10-like protein